MRKRVSRSAVSLIVFAARARQRRAMLRSTFLVSMAALGYAAALSLLALSASSPAAAQFICTAPTSNPLTCTNSGSAITTNTGTANGFASQTTGGGDATSTNSGSNAGGILAQTTAGGNAATTNNGSDTIGDVAAVTFTAGNATANNSGTIGNVNTLDFSTLQARALGTGNATATNSGNVAGGLATVTFGGGTATTTNSGNTAGGLVALTSAGGDATATNSGNVAAGIAAVTAAGGNATAINSGTSTGDMTLGTVTGGVVAIAVGGGNAAVTNSGTSTIGGLIALAASGGNATVTNSGVSSGSTTFGPLTGNILTVAPGGNATVINSCVTNGGIGIEAAGNATLTNIVGGRVIGPIELMTLTSNTINFQGGNWLFTVTTVGLTSINTGGAPFVVGAATFGGTPIAVLDPTTFALADRALTNFTGEISEMLQGRFAGLSAGASGGALGFAPAGASPIADQAQSAFSGIPSVAMSYASDARPVIGKAAPPPVPYYDTTIWASGFGGERHQRADGLVLPTDDWAFGGAMGVDRVINSNLRLGAFVGAGASRERVELDVQKIDATYVFGGGYGRFDWGTQFLDFALYGGGIDNKSTRQIANNTVANGLEIATASYGGWFISPEITYGYRVPLNAVTVTPRLRLRYVGGELDGYSESGSMQNLSVGRRSINDLEERGEVELSTVSGAFKGTATVGVIGLERLGNPTINAVLLSQSLSFTTPGERNAVGGVLGLGLQYRPLPNVKLFVAGEGIAMSDRSDSFAATGGAQVSF